MSTRTRVNYLLVVALLCLLFPGKPHAQQDVAKPGSKLPTNEIVVQIGKTENGFSLSKDGILSYKMKPFNPSVKIRPEYVKSFNLSVRRDKMLAGAIAEDVDGQNSAFLLDLASHSSIPLQAAGKASAAQKIFWSPSGRYMLALCSYEGERFISVDLQERKLLEGEFLGPKGRLWAIRSEPSWAEGKDFLTFTVDETCNPFDGPACDAGKVLEQYSVSLDPSTLKVTKKKL